MQPTARSLNRFRELQDQFGPVPEHGVMVACATSIERPTPLQLRPVPSRAPNWPGFRLVKAKRELLGKDSEDWRTYIRLAAPALHDYREIVSLGDQYVV